MSLLSSIESDEALCVSGQSVLSHCLYLLNVRIKVTYFIVVFLCFLIELIECPCYCDCEKPVEGCLNETVSRHSIKN